MLNVLTRVYQLWCTANDKPHLDAMEYLYGADPSLTHAQYTWIKRFTTVWEHFER